jgi:hypothetical protein
MRSSSLSPQEKPAVRRVSNVVTKALGTGLVALGFSGAPANAHVVNRNMTGGTPPVPANNGHRPNSANTPPPVIPPSETSNPAAWVRQRIETAQNVGLGGKNYLVWLATNGGTYETNTPVTAVEDDPVNGPQTLYFDVSDPYIGHDRQKIWDSLQVGQIVAMPGGIFDDNVFPGFETATPRSFGVIDIFNQHNGVNKPDSILFYKHGRPQFEQVGETAPAPQSDIQAAADQAAAGIP